MGSSWIRPPTSDTTSLYISSMTKHASPLRIDWGRLPLLRKVEIHAFDVNLEALKGCQFLRKLCLDLSCPFKKLPKWVANLPLLEVLMTTCTATTRLHFVSPHLRICLLPKTTAMSSVSNQVPPGHLAHTYTQFFNLNAMSDLMFD